MRKLLLLAMSLSFVLATWAQNKNITGVVRGEKGDPVPFASLTFKGKMTGTTADNDGAFNLKNIPKGTTLIISAAGYIRREVVVDDAVTYTVTLRSKGAEQLNEVVVIKP